MLFRALYVIVSPHGRQHNHGPRQRFKNDYFNMNFNHASAKTTSAFSCCYVAKLAIIMMLWPLLGHWLCRSVLYSRRRKRNCSKASIVIYISTNRNCFESCAIGELVSRFNMHVMMSSTMKKECPSILPSVQAVAAGFTTKLLMNSS